LWLDEFSVVYNPTIATGTISPTTYYVSALTGTIVTVPFTLTGTYNGGNTITAELSDASGSFAAPTTIGAVVATASGNLTATIPANTASGTGYRIRVVSSNPALTAATNGSDITVVLVGNSVAPSATQNIGANTNGTTLTVTENGTATSREWKFSTVSGSGYGSFGPAQTANTYIPNFASFGTYYVVCVSSFPGGLTVTSNEVQVNVVENSIAPTASQSILVGVNGTLLTVSENPAGTSREWYSAAISGGPYSMITPMQMGTTYTPNFASAGTYYVVCESIINGVTAISNEVLINVGNATITTGTIAGSPFLFSATHSDAGVTVPFITSGTFNNGNVFTAQLSDGSGSFAAPTNIGSVSATSSGNISATILHTIAAGTGYRIRVVSNNPVVLGSDNGTDLIVDQFNNSIAPSTTQSIMHGVNGSSISVTASQPATHEWKYSMTSGSGYISFAPAETGTSYTPNFALPGTYYVVCVSTNLNPGDAVTSNQVEIDVQNGTTITTSAVSGSPFLVSPNMPAAVSADFTSDVVFNVGNIFTAQLSDYNGSFTSAITLGTLSGATIGTISASIPGNTTGSTNYRIRVTSTDPAIIGSDNGTNLEVVPFTNTVTPADTQHLIQNQNGNAITVTETQTASHVWKYTQASGIGYTNFSPSETGVSIVPHFNLVSPYYIICESTNGANDKVISQEVVVIVTSSVGIGEEASEMIKAFWNGNDFMVDLSTTKLISPSIEIINVQGAVVLKEQLNGSSMNLLSTHLSSGVYLFSIREKGKLYKGKTTKN
ncbi:MAG: T9SS type A sorting domain-containing protein, partial [Bacteroidetes bacterium]|nr:T9SS type A sorting domain-containing protein [Bacteroidota bacterium]